MYSAYERLVMGASRVAGYIATVPLLRFAAYLSFPEFTTEHELYTWITLTAGATLLPNPKKSIAWAGGWILEQIPQRHYRKKHENYSQSLKIHLITNNKRLNNSLDNKFEQD